jgi:hypothetical protein
LAINQFISLRGEKIKQNKKELVLYILYDKFIKKELVLYILYDKFINYIGNKKIEEEN